MTPLRCLQVGRMLDRGVSQLDPAERLVVEDHLEQCPRCAEHAAWLSTLRNVITEGDGALAPKRRERVIERAIRSAGDAEPTTPAAERPWAALAAAALAVATLVFVMVEIVAGNDSSTPMTAQSGLVQSPQVLLPSPPPAVPAMVPVSGDVELTAAAEARAGAGAEIEVGRSRVTVLEDAVLRWHADTTTLTLTRGAIAVDVAPADGRVFRVATEGFVVVVLGTLFEVTMDGVTVHRGRVRVVDPSGETLVELGPDGSWTSRDRAEPPQPRPANPDALIGQARRMLAARDPKGARVLLRRALGTPLDGAREAEARSLLAECALLEGDDAAAARHYEKVARKHKDTLAGETALFAQARAEMAAGKTNRARATLRRYLARYPAGRFASEARTRLQRLGQ